MKCKHCDGDGVIVDVEYGHAGKYGCKYCDGKGVIEPLTNEEWFCSLPTEDKAKWLSQRSQIIYDCGQRDVFPKIMYEEDWEWLLKQPHTEKE